MSIFPTITLQDIKKHGTKALPKEQAAYLIVNSRKHSVVIPCEDYEALIDLVEDLEDIAAIEARKNEPVIPFDKAFPAKKKQ